MDNLISTSAKFYHNNRWIKFRLNIGEYDNILDFLSKQNIYFLAEDKLDFTTIPTVLHGKGRSNNLLDYVSNNNDDPSLIFRFIDYFMSTLVDIRYSSGKRLNFSVSFSEMWQNMKMTVFSSYTPPIVTTTAVPSTTPLPLQEVFNQLYDL